MSIVISLEMSTEIHSKWQLVGKMIEIFLELYFKFVYEQDRQA